MTPSEDAACSILTLKSESQNWSNRLNIKAAAYSHMNSSSHSASLEPSFSGDPQMQIENRTWAG